MNFYPDKYALRQVKYRERAYRARRASGFLMIGFFMTVSAALWSEPKTASQLETGLEYLQPVLQTAGVQSAGVVGSDTTTAAAQTAASATAEPAEVIVSAQNGLPTSTLPVNRALSN